MASSKETIIWVTGLDAFAIYRLPHAGRCTLVGQDDMPMALTSLTGLSHERGYVIAPFTVDKSMPALMLRPDLVKQCSLDDVAAMQELPFHQDGKGLPLQSASREDYHNDFFKFHHAFSSAGLYKLVLARCADVVHHGTNTAMLFVKACKAYPEAFVTLFSAPQCGTWLVATPEVLLTRDGDHWCTMALAGTMPYREPLPQWSDKNVQEQFCVSRYIGDCLSHYSRDVSMNGPYTTRAGSLAHLRTDFSFTLTDDVAVGTVLDALHPTPAVCGFPKQEAHSFIMENETCDRGYFSGFSGPLNLDGNTAFFVSLRCMRIMEDRYRLYAGGGILPQSVEDMEWRETAAKMQAMLSIIEEYSHELQ